VAAPVKKSDILTTYDCARKARRWANTDIDSLHLSAIIESEGRGMIAIIRRAGGREELGEGTYIGRRCYKVTKVDWGGVTFTADAKAPIKPRDPRTYRVAFGVKK